MAQLRRDSRTLLSGVNTVYFAFVEQAEQPQGTAEFAVTRLCPLNLCMIRDYRDTTSTIWRSAEVNQIQSSRLPKASDSGSNRYIIDS
mmetsp:Transcript_12864/g.27543  ORF Transcript_12864/g.27543 Transcript_12864/m.27543 type:complete len:88 (+) Transcript_12864:164-427(+)